MISLEKITPKASLLNHPDIQLWITDNHEKHSELITALREVENALIVKAYEIGAQNPDDLNKRGYHQVDSSYHAIPTYSNSSLNEVTLAFCIAIGQARDSHNFPLILHRNAGNQYNPAEYVVTRVQRALKNVQQDMETNTVITGAGR